MFFQLHSQSPFSWFDNKEFDGLLDRAREVSDPEARKALYAKAQALAIDQAPLLPAHQTNSIFAVRQNVVWNPAIGEMILLYEAERK